MQLCQESFACRPLGLMMRATLAADEVYLPKSLGRDALCADEKMYMF